MPESFQSDRTYFTKHFKQDLLSRFQSQKISIEIKLIDENAVSDKVFKKTKKKDEIFLPSFFLNTGLLFVTRR